MRKFISIIMVIVGSTFLIYGVSQLSTSYIQQKKGLNKAKEFISDEIADKNDIDLSEVYMDIKEGDTIGILYIPKLERELPIISGTNEEELARGVGHYSSTALPGQKDQILLSGHRDTVFRQFGELEHGDEIHVKMKYGTFIYEIFDSLIVDADDQTIIRSTAPDELLTLSTCYPFSYIGNAPDRYVIYAR